MQSRDYKNFDYIDVIVKKQNEQEIIDGYLSFLWQKIDAKEDRRYNDIVHLSFKREVSVPNKDRLQLLQVYYETALNNRAEIEFKKHSKSKRAICILAFFSLAGLFFAGVFIYFLKSLISIAIGGVVALSILALDMFFAKKIKKKFLSENIDNEIKIKKADQEIRQMLLFVKDLIKKGQAETENGGNKNENQQK